MRIGKKLMMIISSFLILAMGGCAKFETTEINVLATTDLHGMVPYSIAEYVSKERDKDPDITLVDAGDFHDSDGYGPMDKYAKEIRTYFEEGVEKYVEYPLAKDMADVGYDSVVLGNHEFVSNVRFSLDNIISDFEKNGVDVLSANTYKENNENYVKPYTIKEIDTEGGVVKLGILGLTIKEVGEGKSFDENGNLVEAESRELKDQYGYDGKLYMNDLVDEANKWSKIMKEDENADVIVAVVHSGEKPKKPKNPGNRIQEIAQESEYIDAIVAGHTHKQFDQHDYKNKNNEDVIVTQPGKHGECISKITFELENKKGSWNVVSKKSKLTEFEKDMSDDYAGELIYNIASVKEESTEMRLSELTPFEWDKAYTFETNTPVEKIYETVGYKWRSIVEATNDSMLQTVFMKDDKVVCYLVGDTDMMGISLDHDKLYYKDGILEIYSGDNDKYSVKKGDDIFETHLTYIGKEDDNEKDIKITRDNSNVNGALGISGVGADYIIENIKGGKYKVNFYSKEYENGELVNENEIYNVILDENDENLSVGIYQEDKIIRMFNDPSAIYSNFHDVTVDFFNDAPKGISLSALEKEKILTINEEVPIALFSLSDEDKEVSGLNIDQGYQLELTKKDLVVFIKCELIN